jgi:serine/threonine protein kinase/Flp pilus assembly protein TadD
MPQRLCDACRRPVEANVVRCRHCGRTAVHSSVTQPMNQTSQPPQPARQPAQSPAANLPRQLGQYRVVRELGRGGMGQVLEAVDEPLGRRVAVKILLQAANDSATNRRRFMEEARITGCLEHPGIAPVYSLGRGPDGAEYFSMKLVAGRNLNEIIDAWHRRDADIGRQYSLPRLVAIFERVVETVAYAHAQNVLHRDLKPANVMVGAHGEVWVLDWGLAKIKDQESGARSPEPAIRSQGPAIAPQARGNPGTSGSDTDQTQAGSIVGTPQYMAPEQAKGTSIDHRADIYGLGAILYKMLTGQSPNKGADYMGTLMNAALGDVPRIRSTPAGRRAPAELTAIAEKCLALKPEDRYASAVDLLADLRAYEAGDRVRAYPESFLGRLIRWSLRHRRLVAISTLSLTLVLAGWTTIATLLAAKDRKTLDAERTAQAARAESAARAQRRMEAFGPYAEATDLLLRGQSFDQAAQLLETAVKVDPEFPEAQFALGEALRLAGTPGRAAKEYLRANELSKQITGKPHLQALLAAGMAFDGAGEYIESEKTYQQAEREGAAHPLALVGKSFRLAHEQHFAEARTIAEEALRKAPHLWETHFACGYVMEELANHGYLPPDSTRAQSTAHFRKALELSPRQAEACVWLGRSLARQRTAESRVEGLRLFDHAVALEPKNGNRYVIRGMIRIGIGDLKGADSDLRQARELGAARLLLIHADAMVAAQRGDYETAFKLSGEVIRVARPWPPAVGNWVALGFQLKKDKEVQSTFDNWCKENPNYPEVYSLRAQLKARDGDYRGAVVEDRAGLKVAPYQQRLRTQLAVHLAHLQNWSESLTAADAALELSPNDYTALVIRTRCLAELGRSADARSLLNRLQKDFPSRAKDVETLRRSLAEKLKG